MIPYESALLTISCGHIFLERFVKHGHYAGFYPLRCPGLSSAWSLQHGVWMLWHDQNSLIYMHFHVVHFGNKHEISSKQHNGKVRLYRFNAQAKTEASPSDLHNDPSLAIVHLAGRTAWIS